MLSDLGLWGVLKEHRLGLETSCSKALVRHEADPGATLAGMLNLSLRDIQVREGSSSDTIAKASTAPSPHPVIPTPIRRIRNYSLPCETFLLHTISESIGAGVKTIASACRLVLAVEFLGGDAGGR
jgi:hypothetical protein